MWQRCVMSLWEAGSLGHVAAGSDLVESRTEICNYDTISFLVLTTSKVRTEVQVTTC